MIVLSNVLEHIDDRVGLLRELVASAQPRVVLIRVPVLAGTGRCRCAGSWGWSTSATRTTRSSTTRQALRDELEAAGLRVTELQAVWGEIWAAAEPVR